MIIKTIYNYRTLTVVFQKTRSMSDAQTYVTESVTFAYFRKLKQNPTEFYPKIDISYM